MKAFVLFSLAMMTFALVGCDHEGGMQPNLGSSKAEIRSQDYVDGSAGLSEALFSADTIDVLPLAAKTWFVGETVRVSALVWNTRTNKPIPKTDVEIYIGPHDGGSTQVLRGEQTNWTGKAGYDLKVEGPKLTAGRYRLYAKASWGGDFDVRSVYFYFEIKAQQPILPKPNIGPKKKPPARKAKKPIPKTKE